jgi:Holliday junction resolvase RusA-like endonuclease
LTTAGDRAVLPTLELPGPAQGPLEGRDYQVGRRFHFTVYGEAKSQGSKRAWYNAAIGRVQMVEQVKGLGDWRKRVAQAAGEQCISDPLIDGPCSLSIVVYRQRPKSAPRRVRFPATAPDASKLLRAIEDALTGILYVDDSRIVDARISKRFGVPERAEITLEEWI